MTTNKESEWSQMSMVEKAILLCFICTSGAVLGLGIAMMILAILGDTL